MHLKVELMEIAAAPETIRDRVLFSYSTPEPTRRVGISFLHENFREIHTFTRNDKGVFFLSYRPPENVDRLVYRFVVDGLWIPDPNNNRTVKLPPEMLCSVYEPVFFEEEKKARTLSTRFEEEQVVFRYPGERVGRISVAGSFNHWDPYMYKLSQDPDHRNLYSFSLSLPRGVYYYYYVVDGERIPDPTNPQTARTRDGTLVSVLEVRG